MAQLITSHSGGRGTISSQRRVVTSKDKETGERSRFMPPPQPFQVMPTNAVLQQFVKRALDAMSNGFYWDRGSIINLVL